MKVADIRQKYLQFFESKGHQIVDSAPIVLKNDPTLMFINAGMNQFKDIFLDNEEAKYKRAVDTQKCLRVSGKHNDLEEVGVDTYHHTMFEMLGNWSFGDYYKKEAINWAWELLTEVYGLDKGRIYVTVFEGDKADNLSFDQEAFDIWKELIDEDRIIAASKKDNFWEMGAVGPCGPCSEIHVDMRSDEERAKVSGKSLVNADHPAVIEIWNLVFMESLRMADKSLRKLSAQHIDTGMGLERLCMVLQGKQSTYDTDVFGPLISFVGKHTGVKYAASDSKTDIAIRVLVDHIRAVSFAIADGQMPSNTGAGYVIRRILRRAVRYAYSFLNTRDAFLYQLAEVLIAEMGGFFKELEASKVLIMRVIKEEEESFLRTLSKGIDLIEKIMSESKGKEISGKVAFELYDTFGFPADLTSLILGEQGMTFDEKEFDAELEKQKARSRKDAVLATTDWVVWDEKARTTVFIGYDQLVADIQIVRYRKVSQKGKDLYHLVFDQTPFYPEGGGQVGDKGFVAKGETRLPIINTYRENNLIVHVTPKSPADFSGVLKAEVNAGKRNYTTKNHSATHLLHHALREVLGDHVAQKGSLVQDDYLRFDFSHFSKVSPEEIRSIEKKVNAMIRQDVALDEKRSVPIQTALDMGAIALFGEKYGDEVRVIKFGESVELCGGTHVARTGEIGFFKIKSEGSVASGIRRIEAVSGEASENLVFEEIDTLNELRRILKSAKDPVQSVVTMIAETHDLQKQMEVLIKEKAQSIKSTLVASIERIGDVNFIAAKVDLEGGAIKDLAFQLRKEHAPLFMVLASGQKDKATIAVALSDGLVTENRFNSGSIIKELASYIHGGGGGQAFYATAGGKNPEGIEQALIHARTFLSQG